MQKQPELRLPRGVLASSPLPGRIGGEGGRQAAVPPERKAGRERGTAPGARGWRGKKTRRKEGSVPLLVGEPLDQPRGGGLFPIPARLPLAQGTPEAEPFDSTGADRETLLHLCFVCLGEEKNKRATVSVWLGSGISGLLSRIAGNPVVRLLNQAAKSFPAAAFAACPFSPT